MISCEMRSWAIECQMSKLASLLTVALVLIGSAAIPAPFNAARTLDGTTFQAAGHVTIVHYWATWCAPCRLEMPILDAYYRKHRGEGLKMVAVSIDQSVTANKLKNLTSKYAFPVARIDDIKMPRRDIPTALPINRVYDKSGQLRFQIGGDGRSTIDAATLEHMVSPLLSR